MTEFKSAYNIGDYHVEGDKPNSERQMIVCGA
jgi:hypothetical protein